MTDQMTNQLIALALAITLIVAVYITYKLYRRAQIGGFSSGDPNNGLASIADKKLSELSDQDLINAMVADIKANVESSTKWIKIFDWVQKLSLTFLVFASWNYLAIEYGVPILGQASTGSFRFVPFTVIMLVIFTFLHLTKSNQQRMDVEFVKQVEDTEGAKSDVSVSDRLGL